MAAHGHAAEGCERYAQKKQDVQDRCNCAVGIIFPFEKSTVPLPVQDLMDDDEHRHTHADPLMSSFTGDLVGHEKKKKDGHSRIHDFSDSVVRFGFGHETVLLVIRFLSVFPGYFPIFWSPVDQTCFSFAAAGLFCAMTPARGCGT